MISRINKLQDEKQELMNSNNDLKSDRLKQEEVLKRVFESLTHIRGGLEITRHKSMAEQVESKVGDMNRLIKELEDDNVQLT